MAIARSVGAVSLLALDGLRELEVVRVRGLKRIEPERFGRLERLLVEDQIQLGGLRFGRSPSLSSLRIVNCKTFDRLERLARLEGLEEIRVSRTHLDLEKLIEAGLPRSGVPELHESELANDAVHAVVTPVTLAPLSVAPEHPVPDTVTVVLADACAGAATSSPACPDASVTVAVYVVVDDGQT